MVSPRGENGESRMGKKVLMVEVSGVWVRG